jgi:hypothetical protein
MNPQEILDKMTDEQKQALLNEEIPAEIEKQAQAEVDQKLLADSCYNFGYLTAAENLALEEGEGDLAKVATAEEIKEHTAALETEKQNIETLVSDMGVADVEDEVDFAKTAQALAGFMFEGFADCLTKAAEGRSPKAVMKYVGKAREAMRAGGAKMKHTGGEALKHVRTHKKKYIGGGAAAAGLGYLGKKMHDKSRQKTAAEADSIDIAEQVKADIVKIASIDESLKKLAAHAAKKGDELKKHMKD